MIFEEVFGRDNVEVVAYGNVLTCAAFLYGLAVEDLRASELDHCDTDYELLICVRATKSDLPLREEFTAGS
ncbi:hypothetical protein ACFL59_12170 [Planctomycetota bacterium]